MTKIKVKISKTYNIYIGKNLLSCCGKLIKEAAGGKKAVIISDDLVFPIYGGFAKKSLSENGYEVLSFVFPHGEKQKNADTFIKILEFLGKNNVSRFYRLCSFRDPCRQAGWYLPLLRAKARIR